jgi:hypothetical protein
MSWGGGDFRAAPTCVGLGLLMGANGGLPNMRLKLAGLSFLGESEWLCPGGHGLSSTSLAPAGPPPAA